VVTPEIDILSHGASAGRWRGRGRAPSAEREELSGGKNKLGFLTSHLIYCEVIT
jgi:hypothetical protein